MIALALTLAGVAAATVQAPAVEPAVPTALARTGGGDASITAREHTRFDCVMMISVDGLRSDALVAGGDRELPNFHRLMRGAGTLNARTDPDFTVTLPNHTGMLTGRTVLGKDGHGWTENGEPKPGVTLHSNSGRYVASVFDVAHDHGLFTAMYVAKTKFSLYDTSYDAEHGGADRCEADDGRDKLDLFAVADDDSKITAALLDGLRSARTRADPRSLSFVHYAALDRAGHSSGWDLTPNSRYMKAVASVDAELGRLFAAIDADTGLRGKVAIVLTADHGGGAPFRSHDLPHMWVDYIIPFLVWTGTDDGPRDLYAVSALTRRDPALRNPRTDDVSVPVRNADAANVSLMLLGLPPVPGSTVGANQDLDVFGEESRKR